ncbi:hypothetical protein [Leptolyngbya phage Lbo-JY12]
MRFSTVQTSFDTATALTQGRTNTIDVVYRGTLTGNTLTELTIDNIPGRRLVPDRAGAFSLLVQAVEYNVTSGAVFTNMMYVTGSVSAAGVITLQNNTSLMFGAGSVPAALTNGLGNGGADNGFIFDVVAASGNTPAYLRLQARGAAGATTSWEITVRGVEVTALNN